MSVFVLFFCMFLFGYFLSGLNNLVQGSCAADLAKNSSLQSDSKSASVVISVVDASGALGSSVG